MTINNNLKAYKDLGILKGKFRESVTAQTLWSNATFYNKMSGSFEISPLEQACLDKLFTRYQNLKSKL